MKSGWAFSRGKVFYLEARVRGEVKRWPLAGSTWIVGRAESCDLRLEDKSVSRTHLRLSLDGQTLCAEDLGSANGLVVEGQRVERAQLRLGQWFAAGAVMLVFRRGLTLVSGGGPVPEGDSDRVPATFPPGGDAAKNQGAGGPAVSGSAWDHLAARLEEAAGAEPVLETLLEGLLALFEVSGAVLLEPVEGALMIRAAAGELPAPQTERMFQEAIGRPGAGGAILRGNGFLAYPVRRSRGPSGWLLLHPGPNHTGPRPELRLIAALCGAWREAEPEAACPEVPGPGLPEAEADGGSGFVCLSGVGQTMLGEVDRLARTNLPVLLCGESGTGKELLARRLHSRSGRGSGPFVALNCAALPRELLEAELFGIERGVATGVEARPGRFADADGGTLLLDEIGDLPLELQPKLLRVLESGEVARLGARRPVPIDVRIVAATHQDLAERVKAQAFRRDLYHRIAGATVRVPALRERPEDILPLAREFARRAAAASGRRLDGLTLEAARLLLGYRWPGNVRELSYAIARAVALADGRVLHPELLPPEIAGGADPGRADLILGLSQDFRQARQGFEKCYFERLLQRARGNMSEAARAAGLTRSHLYNKLKELGLRLPAEGE